MGPPGTFAGNGARLPTQQASQGGASSNNNNRKAGGNKNATALATAKVLVAAGSHPKKNEIKQVCERSSRFDVPSLAPRRVWSGAFSNFVLRPAEYPGRVVKP